MATVQSVMFFHRNGYHTNIIQLVGGFKHEFYFPFHIWDN